MVVIFVKRPATISITSVTGIPLISYRFLSSSPLRFLRDGECGKGSSLGNSTTCDKFCRMTGAESSDLRPDRAGDCLDLGEGVAGVDVGCGCSGWEFCWCIGVEECDADDDVDDDGWCLNTVVVGVAPRADVGGGWINVGVAEADDRADVHCSDDVTELVVEA